MATRTGTDANEFIPLNASQGSGFDDFAGGLGNDQVVGWALNDILYGDIRSPDSGPNDGDDVVVGGSDSDVIYGNGGNDLLIGHYGDGRFDFATDRLFGGDGNDLLLGDSGNDILDGGEGMDVALYVSPETAANIFYDPSVIDWIISTPSDGNDRLSNGVEFAAFNFDVNKIDANPFDGISTTETILEEIAAYLRDPEGTNAVPPGPGEKKIGIQFLGTFNDFNNNVDLNEIATIPIGGGDSGGDSSSLVAFQRNSINAVADAIADGTLPSDVKTDALIYYAVMATILFDFQTRAMRSKSTINSGKSSSSTLEMAMIR